MTLQILLIVLLSASLHPFRDLLLKRLYSPGLCYLSICLSWVIFAILHALAVGAPLTISLDYLPYIAGSAAGLFIYYYGTLMALKKGDLSIYYPIIRCSPVFVVFVGWAFLEQSYSLVLLAGIGLVLLGVFLIQRTGAKQKKFFSQPMVLILALTAMTGSGIHSLVDSYAMQAADSSAMEDIDVSTFLIWVYLALSIMFWVTFSITKHPKNMSLRKQIIVLWKRHLWRVLGASALSYASYVLILLSYGMGGNVAAVTSLRLWSIPLTVILSAIILKEGGFGRRIATSGVIVAGILVIVMDR